jgi:tetratricopeptide (TPR) repeat protein
LVACSSNSKKLDEAVNLYNLAINNNDITASRVALNQIMLLDSSLTQYQDSIARLFISTGNFEAGLRYAEKVQSAGKCDDKLKESMALAYQQIGKTDTAKTLLKELMSKTKDSKYLFQQLVILYESQDVMAFDSMSSSILTQLNSDTALARSVVPMPGPISQQMQQVPLKAATYFLIGNNALNTKNDVKTAVEYLQLSLKEYNQFEMPRYVLQEIEQMMMTQRR